ncbi:MAG: type II toxin-antitoxin system HicA family toxin [Thermoplasmata archaeon]
MAKLPILAAREILKVLGHAGFVVVSQRGSHIKLRGERGGIVRMVIVPNYAQVPRGVLASILRQAGLTREAFSELL